MDVHRGLSDAEVDRALHGLDDDESQPHHASAAIKAGLLLAQASASKRRARSNSKAAALSARSASAISKQLRRKQRTAAVAYGAPVEVSLRTPVANKAQSSSALPQHSSRGCKSLADQC